MLILTKDSIIKVLLSCSLIFLSFTNVFIFSVVEARISLYIFSLFVFILIILGLRSKIPNLTNQYVLLFYILLSFLVNFKASKITSVIYSGLFIIYYVYLFYLVKKFFVLSDFLRVLKIIILSYFIVLLISQFLVIFDLYSLNTPYNDYFQSTGPLGIQRNNITKTFRYHSLSSEPSYAAIIMIICYNIIILFNSSKREVVLYGIIVLYMILSFKSAIGIILLLLLIVGNLRLSSKQILLFLLPILVITLLMLYFNFGGKSIERIRNLILLIFSSEGEFLKRLNLIDSSAYARLNPFYVYIRDVNFLDLHFYLGHGANTSEEYFTEILYPNSWESHLSFRPGFIPGFLYDYGILGVVFVFNWLLLKIIKIKRNLFFIALISILMLNSNFNTQLFWIFVTFYTIANMFLINSNSISSVSCKMENV
ncbi:hypothetical protein [Abyssalbus ytuae]|uniref:Uncharacterized protein n=1 Tax=Abyssalbus ytuae TaxID=2926907 RepID=A0A9E7CV58_9FLAO|nr:hypothetical protein [Abyssalbus ytuae]UOB19422.1 hypothetical protein MQE35_09010 [Abyssalbus ytuae]